MIHIKNIKTILRALLGFIKNVTQVIISFFVPLLALATDCEKKSNYLMWCFRVVIAALWFYYCTNISIK